MLLQLLPFFGDVFHVLLNLAYIFLVHPHFEASRFMRPIKFSGRGAFTLFGAMNPLKGGSSKLQQATFHVFRFQVQDSSAITMMHLIDDGLAVC